jgi:hypothetical protein
VNRRSCAVLAGIGLLTLGTAGCGGREGAAETPAASAESVAPATPTASPATTGTPLQPAASGTPGPAGLIATPFPAESGGTPAVVTGSPAATQRPTGRPTITLTPPPAPTPFQFPANFSTPHHHEAAQIATAYQAFLADTAGLDANFDAGWVTRMRQVATPKLVHDSREVAAGLQELNDHTIGALRDSHEGIKVKQSKAVVIDCLDEVDWYVVDDKNGRADHGATRGDFSGFATLVHTATGWRVSTWKPGQLTCTF